MSRKRRARGNQRHLGTHRSDAPGHVAGGDQIFRSSHSSTLTTTRRIGRNNLSIPNLLSLSPLYVTLEAGVSPVRRRSYAADEMDGSGGQTARASSSSDPGYS